MPVSETRSSKNGHLRDRGTPGILGRFSGCSRPLDNEYCFIVNAVCFSGLPEVIVISCSVLQQRIADIFCWPPIVFPHHCFEVLAFFTVVAVINTIGI